MTFDKQQCRWQTLLSENRLAGELNFQDFLLDASKLLHQARGTHAIVFLFGLSNYYKFIVLGEQITKKGYS